MGGLQQAFGRRVSRPAGLHLMAFLEPVASVRHHLMLRQVQTYLK